MTQRYTERDIDMSLYLCTDSKLFWYDEFYLYSE